ncbi:tetratricopeptide repeat-containing sensor histidine kinase [Flavobacterium maritimum]|uniref:tetratricopeptide repeat-containing sensor histidine kinase n=1 Tax=Flavobacterium maritimum TaxID=3149042 RepID=UPI0032B380EC
MKLKKVHSPIFVLLGLFFILQSCEKQQTIPTTAKTKTAYEIYIDRAEKYYGTDQFDSAFYYYNKIKSNSDLNKDQDKILYSLLKMAAIQQIQGDYVSSEATATETIPLFQKTTDPYYKIAIYNSLGINYKELFDFDNAILYYNKALDFTKDELTKTILKNNIAGIYMDKADYQKAIAILLPLSQQKDVINNPEHYARVLGNLGSSYFKTGDSKSLNCLNQSLAIRKKINDDFGMVAAYLNLSEYYKETNPASSYQYAELAYEKATKVNNANDRLETLALLIHNSSGNQSKKHSEDYLRINDSINKVKQKAKNQFAKIKYDSKKERDENLQLKAQKVANALELEKQKNKNLISYFLIFSGILVTTFLYYFWKAKNKRAKVKATYDTEIRISKKLHDELANDVYHAMAFAETQDLSSSQNKELLLNNLDTIYSRTRNISKENSIIETGLQFVPNLKEMMATFNTNEINILVNGLDTINWNALESTKKITLYRVLQELLVNMKKHSKCSLVVIAFKENDKNLQIDYSDNGLGADISQINIKNGLQNVENRILAIKGSITFDSKSNKGFKVSITFPL